MGDVDDTSLMLNFVRSKFPRASFVGAIGITAGSGQIVSFLSRQPEDGPVDPAVSICPAYTLLDGMSCLQDANPILSRLLVENLNAFFLLPNRRLLKDLSGYDEAMRATSVLEFIEKYHCLAGFDSLEEYVNSSGPSKCPIEETRAARLLINSADDPLCVKEDIDQEKACSWPNYALVYAGAGSHIAFREGHFGQSSFGQEIAMDFLESAARIKE